MKNIKEIWKSLHDSKTATAEHMVQYCILRAMQSRTKNKITLAKILLAKAFTPITNKVKLVNGRTEHDTVRRMVHIVALSKTVLGKPYTDIFDSQEEYNEYMSFTNMLHIQSNSIGAKYVYVFTRQDITPEYQLVQSAHVTLKLGNKLNGHGVDDLYFCVVGVKDLGELRQVETDLVKSGLKFESFLEPDIHWDKKLQLTSIATFPVESRNRGRFLEFDKLKFG